LPKPLDMLELFHLIERVVERAASASAGR
jgi:hypothetical protein